MLSLFRIDPEQSCLSCGPKGASLGLAGSVHIMSGLPENVIADPLTASSSLYVLAFMFQMI